MSDPFALRMTILITPVQRFSSVAAFFAGHPIGLEHAMHIRILTTLAIISFGASTALAEPMSSENKALLQQSCTGDFTEFCGDMPPEDGPETRACFEKNMAKLSPECQSAIKSFKGGKKG